ncbi:PE family protein, partial [Mycobacterium basiliense]
MSYVVAAPGAVTAAAAHLASIGATVDTANSAAAIATTRLLPAGSDEVSVSVASMFSGYALTYQHVAARVTAFHNEFVRALNASAGAYTAAEGANAAPLQTVEQGILRAVNAPTETLLGRPLIGDGAAGTAASPNGSDGGLLYGNGGAGFDNSATAGAAGGNGGNAGLIGNG